MIFSRQRGFNLQEHIRRTNAQPYMGPPIWQEAVEAPSVRETYTDLDGQDAAARQRAIAMRWKNGKR